MPSNDRGFCAFCGNVATERDHVPPKCLFPSPRPSNLITVPTCRGCHHGTSMDDEYLRAILVMREDVAGHPGIEAIRGPVNRGLMRHGRGGLRRELIESIGTVDVMSDAGLWLARKPTITVSKSRTAASVERTVRGLFFHETGRRLPDDHRISVYLDADVIALMGEEPERVELLADHIRGGTSRILGDGVFQYRYRAAVESDAVTGWLVTYFEDAGFLALTFPPTDELRKLVGQSAVNESAR